MNNANRMAKGMVAAALRNAALKSGKRPIDIALASKFQSVEEWQQIVDGKAPLPGTKVGDVAKALNLDPIELGRLVIAEYHPEFLELYDAVPAEYLPDKFSCKPRNE